MRAVTILACAVVLLASVRGAAADPRCPCKCPCAAGKPCDCGPKCLCEGCQGKGGDYEAGFARVMKGERLLLAVGVKATAGQYQAPAMPGTVPGVYDWFLHDGKPCITPRSATAGPAVRVLPAYYPFGQLAVPGCATGRCVGNR